MKVSKRLWDLCWSILGLILLLPLFSLIILTIYLFDGTPILFRQERIGYRGVPFQIWKFRTMVVEVEEKGGSITVGQDKRITRVGQWLRKFKLDELPQLFNVVRGEMSLVGPRPEVPQYVSLFTDEQRGILNLVPGITNPASIVYWNEQAVLAEAEDPEWMYLHMIMPDKIRINLEYAERATTLSDFLVILSTLAIPFRRNLKTSTN
jgi:lipopolysaccharide/colanic/teichoic acid biosynthesis glycosyltransferase